MGLSANANESSSLHEGWGDQSHAGWWNQLADNLGRYEFIDNMEKASDTGQHGHDL